MPSSLRSAVRGAREALLDLDVDWRPAVSRALGAEIVGAYRIGPTREVLVERIAEIKSPFASQNASVAQPISR